jgi:adenylate cyclase class 2
MRRFGNIARVAIAMVERQSGESVYNFPMASAKKTNREVEIKVRVPDVALMRRLLQRAGAVAQRRVFEQNALFDTLAADLRARGRLVRLRVETPVTEFGNRSGAASALLTAKSPASDRPRSAKRSKYKERMEREVPIRNTAKLLARLAALGLKSGFRYEKYRTSYRLGSLHVELDETPVGTFLELEGTPDAIDAAAHQLGVRSKDRLLATYWGVYADDCRRRGVRPTNMLFR